MREWWRKVGVTPEIKVMKMGCWQCSPFKACQISIKVQFSPNLWCACGRQRCCFEQFMCGWMISSDMMHYTPLTCNNHQSITYISAYNPLINVVVHYAKLHWSFDLIISPYLFMSVFRAQPLRPISAGYEWMSGCTVIILFVDQWNQYSVALTFPLHRCLQGYPSGGFQM